MHLYSFTGSAYFSSSERCHWEAWQPSGGAWGWPRLRAHLHTEISALEGEFYGTVHHRGPYLSRAPSSNFQEVSSPAKEDLATMLATLYTLTSAARLCTLRSYRVLGTVAPACGQRSMPPHVPPHVPPHSTWLGQSSHSGEFFVQDAFHSQRKPRICRALKHGYFYGLYTLPSGYNKGCVSIWSVGYFKHISRDRYKKVSPLLVQNTTIFCIVSVYICLKAQKCNPNISPCR